MGEGDGGNGEESGVMLDTASKNVIFSRIAVCFPLRSAFHKPSNRRRENRRSYVKGPANRAGFCYFGAAR